MLQKGKLYENHIKELLLEKHDKVFLWNEITLETFINAGFFDTYADKRRLNKIKASEPVGIIDTGCDILYYDGNKWVIVQCKNYTNTIYINDIAGFSLIVANNPQNRAELYYTSNLSRNITLYKNNNIKFVNEKMVDKVVAQQKLIPYDYQLDAVKALIKEKRSVLNMCCGLGKTYISMLYCEGIKADVIVMFNEYLSHVDQNEERYKFSYPDYVYTKIDSESDGTRNIEELKDIVDKNQNKVLYFGATYKSTDITLQILQYIHKTYKKRIAVIVDEFHNLSKNDVFSAEVLEEEKDSDMYTIMKSNNCHHLFMSATPRIYKIEDTEYEESDMNNIFGNNVYKYEMREAINKGYICDYDIYLPDITLDKKQILIDDMKEANIDINKEMLIESKYILRSIDELSYNKTICYLRSHEEVKVFESALNEMNKYYNLDLNINSIISTTKKDDRKKIIDEFRSYKGKSLLLSVQILDECIDIAECDSIFMSKVCSSKIKCIQRIMRSTRRDKNNKNKKAGIFLYCDEYDEMVQFMTDMKEFDVGFNVDKVKIVNYQRENKTNVYSRKDDVEKYVNIDKFIVEVSILNYEERWIQNYTKIIDYDKHYHKCPSQYIENEVKLNRWFRCQVRASQGKGTYRMTNKRLELLKVLSFWGENHDSKWMQNYKLLLQYDEQFGKRPSFNDENEKIRGLSVWYTHQITTKETLAKQRLDLLESISFWDNDNDSKWFDIYNKILQYSKTHNKRPSKHSKNDEIKKWGHWICTQYTAIKEGKMTEKRLNFLKNLSFFK